MFFASKLLSLITDPVVWVIGFLSLALWHLPRKPKQAKRILAFALFVLLLSGCQPLPDFLIRHLENQYKEIPLKANLSDYYGIVVLGGGMESGLISNAHSLPQLNGSAERMTATINLIQRHPNLKIVFTGGESNLLKTGVLETDSSKVFFDSFQVSANRVQYESESRNTYENAIYTKRMVGADSTKKWILITSAWHMPRSMGTFQKQGWNVTAFPVDYYTGEHTPWTNYSIGGGISRWQLALHELVGIAAYRVTGRL